MLFRSPADPERTPSDRGTPGDRLRPVSRSPTTCTSRPGPMRSAHRAPCGRPRPIARRPTTWGRRPGPARPTPPAPSPAHPAQAPRAVRFRLLPPPRSPLLEEEPVSTTGRPNTKPLRSPAPPALPHALAPGPLLCSPPPPSSRASRGAAPGSTAPSHSPTPLPAPAPCPPQPRGPRSLFSAFIPFSPPPHRAAFLAPVLLASHARF